MHLTPFGIRHLAFVSLVAAGLGNPGIAQPASKGIGHWEGTVEMQGREIPLAVDLDQSAGKWIGSLSVPGSTTVDVPLSNIEVTEATVRFTAGLMGSPAFDAKFSVDANSLAGSASNAQGDAPVQFKRNGTPKVSVPVGSSRVDLQACKLEYSIVSPK